MNDPKRVELLLQEAYALHRQSRLDAARPLYERVLLAQPENARVWYLVGAIALQTRQPQQAVELIGKALSLDPRNAAAHNDLGRAHFALGQYDAALAACDRAIALMPGEPEFHNERGNVHYQLQRHVAAVASYDAALTLDPNFAGGHYNRAIALHDLQRYEAAVAGFDQAIALKPDHARAFYGRGQALYALRYVEAARDSYATAISLKFDYADAHNSLGNAHFELEQYAAALASYDTAISLEPHYADAHANRGNALYELGEVEAALASCEAAIALQSDYAGIHFNRGQMLDELDRHSAAVASYDRVRALKPDFKFALGHRLLARMHLSDWADYDSDLTELIAGIERGEPVANPFSVIALTGSPSLQKKAAEIWVRERAPPNDALPAIARRSGNDKIRIGYFSADFGDHPVSTLTAGLFEAHDRSRVEVFAFSLGPDTQDPMRRRLEHAFDRFADVHDKSARQVVEMARELQIDIAVDLTGFTRRCRPAIFALRAAPVQVSYLGYLGTMGAPYMDYLIADTAIVPPALRPHYAEKLVYLPCYQANDSRRPQPDRTFARHELGLPPTGFVFCCFNGNYKMTPTIFDVWMRILARAPTAVLMLYAANETVEQNLKKEARKRGVDADRLIFGGRMSTTDYLARYAAADLFLDTLPYNAGTTASDALWVGLPVLTCMGETFAGRVAASLLRAISLPELITDNLAQYEELAVAMAADPDRMAHIKSKLVEHRVSTPLFDTQLQTRALETAYSHMQARHRSDLPPEDIFL